LLQDHLSCHSGFLICLSWDPMLLTKDFESYESTKTEDFESYERQKRGL